MNLHNPNDTNKSIKFVFLGIIGIVIISIGVIGLGTRSIDQPNADWVSSGPFFINKKIYSVDEPLYFVASGLNPTDKGEVIFTRPDGKQFHIIYFVASEKISLEQNFIPVSSSAIGDCNKCGIPGTWEVSFNIEDGTQYAPITFKVVESVEAENDEIEIKQ